MSATFYPWLDLVCVVSDHTWTLYPVDIHAPSLQHKGSEDATSAEVGGLYLVGTDSLMLSYMRFSKSHESGCVAEP